MSKESFKRMLGFLDRKDAKRFPFSLLNFILYEDEVRLYKAFVYFVDLSITSGFSRMFTSLNPFCSVWLSGLEAVKIALFAEATSRLKSLRNPAKKMSKSDPDKKSCIELLDSYETILEKCKKAITDFDSSVTFDPDKRPGVSNLIQLHSLCTDMSVEEICYQNRLLTTAQYKICVAEAVEQVLAPIRSKALHLIEDAGYLENILHKGAVEASAIASNTWHEVQLIIGLK